MCNNFMVFTAHYVGITEVSRHLNTVQGLYYSPEVWDFTISFLYSKVNMPIIYKILKLHRRLPIRGLIYLA